VLGVDEFFIVKFYLYDNTRKTALNKYAGFQKATSGAVIPVLNSFNINKLPSGYYNLKVEVIGKDNAVLATQHVPFYRSNPTADGQVLDLSSIQLGNSFVLGFNNLDTLSFYVDCLHPASSEAERRTAQNVLASGNIELMQRFFLMFWSMRDPVNPEVAWLSYLEVVNYAQKSFGTRSIPGYRTDMGRVLLQYGQPTTIERSFNEPSNYPWQIWQYDVLESACTPSQNNRMFVFVDQALAGRTYVLIHSTGIGEIQDFKWQYALNRNTNRGQNVDATSSPEARDDFGYRVNNNFIIGDHRYWGDR
jgi:GWxTD domain-containing protein